MIYESNLRYNELCHYGVAGMKWGVRRGHADKVFSKAEKKMSKLDAKAKKATKTKMKRSSPVLYTEISKARYEKASRKADKANYKAAKWYKKVSKTLGTKKASEMKNSNGVQIGKEYAKYLMNKNAN